MRAGGLERSLCGAPQHPGKKGSTLESDSWNVSAREILTLPQLLSGNLWLVSSMSAESEPKALWFPGVTTTLCLREAERIVLALSAHNTSGLH